jgi:cystathionine beta-lyase
MSANQPQPVSASAVFRSLTPAVHRASTVVFDDTAAFLARRSRLFDGFSYGLYGTPTSRALEEAVASIEGGTRSIVVPSGLAALTHPTLALLAPGDHVIVADCVYGPTREHCAGLLRRWGVRVDFMPADADGIAALLTDRTRLVVLESPGSYSMEIQDIAAIATQAHAAGARVLADNTWGFGSSRLFEHGVDIVATALSKYAGGHSDVCMGAVTVRDETLFRQLKTAIAAMGLGVSADDAYLVLRGLATLDARLDLHAARALRASQWLRTQPGVACVLNPADPADAAHARYTRFFHRGNGLVSFVPERQDLAALASMIDGLRHFRIGASWGGTESLVALADLSSARSASSRPVPSYVVRLHFGIEPIEPLLQDLEAGLERLRAAPPTPAAPQPKRVVSSLE